MEDHKKKMEAMTQELEMLQLQLQSLGPQKLRGSTVSLTTSSSMAEDPVDVSDEEVKSEQPPAAQENTEQSLVNTDHEQSQDNKIVEVTNESTT